ncbi:MAG: helix-turn-helix domain-containing protein [Treponema sp.]|nr:helix-turn-helix domain-containing protein [Treponema sp.]
MDSNFWQRVEVLLENKNLSRKELAANAKFDVSNIGKGIKEGNIPAADTAVRIAKYLNTTVEYLVTGSYSDDKNNAQNEIDELYKNAEIIHRLNSLPYESRSSIELMISDMSEKYKAGK